MKLNRADLELYAEDILTNVLHRTRFSHVVRDALADRLERVISEVIQNTNRLEARKALKQALKKKPQKEC